MPWNSQESRALISHLLGRGTPIPIKPIPWDRRRRESPAR